MTQAVTQIKYDTEQSAKANQSKVNVLEKLLEEKKNQQLNSAGIFDQNKAEILKASNEYDSLAENEQDRAYYHKFMIVLNRNDQLKFRKELVNIRKQMIKAKENYEIDYQQLCTEQNDMENKLKSQIQFLTHQLKSLREFKERKAMLIEQKKTLEKLIFEEKKASHIETNAIHQKLLDQREFYDQDLRERLKNAQNFATKYADLHIDVLTQKIQDETLSKRKELKVSDSNVFSRVTSCDQIMKDIERFSNQNKIQKAKVESTTLEIIELKKNKKEIEFQMLQTIANHQNDLSEYQETLNEKESEMSQKLIELREQNKKLQNQANKELEDMKAAENARIDFKGTDPKSQFERELLEMIRQSADYLIQAIENKYGASDDAIFLSHKSPMAKLIRRLSLLETEVKAPLDTASKNIVSFSNDPTVDILDIAAEDEFSDHDDNSSIIFQDFDAMPNDENEVDIYHDTNEPSTETENTINTDSLNDVNLRSENRVIDLDFNNDDFTKITKEIQTEKPMRSDLLKGIHAPPTEPHYPYPESLNQSKRTNHKKKIAPKKKESPPPPENSDSTEANDANHFFNYYYSPYANNSISISSRRIKRNKPIKEKEIDVNENKDISTQNEFKPHPPKISNSRRRNYNPHNGTNEPTRFKRSFKDAFESSYSSSTVTPKRKDIQRHEYSVTSDFRKISKAGRMPSAYIRIIRNPR